MEDKLNLNKNNPNPAPSKATGGEIVLSKKEYEELKNAAEEKTQYYDRLLRQQAEFDNFRKRQERERVEFTKFANEEIIVEVLEVLDNLERLVNLAEKHKEDFQSFLKGVELILAHLYELLKKHGVKAIETKDKKFDPMYHEVLSAVNQDGVEDNKIIEEFQKGYLLENRVIRTAKVKVAKKKEDTNQKPEDRAGKPEEEKK